METKSNRTTVVSLRGTFEYKEQLKQKVERIKKVSNKNINLEKLIERGINLALAEYGEKPLTGRLIGRYQEKS